MPRHGAGQDFWKSWNLGDLLPTHCPSAKRECFNARLESCISTKQQTRRDISSVELASMQPQCAVHFVAPTRPVDTEAVSDHKVWATDMDNLCWSLVPATLLRSTEPTPRLRQGWTTPWRAAGHRWWCKISRNGASGKEKEEDGACGMKLSWRFHPLAQLSGKSRHGHELMRH